MSPPLRFMSPRPATPVRANNAWHRPIPARVPGKGVCLCRNQSPRAARDAPAPYRNYNLEQGATMKTIPAEWKATLNKPVLVHLSTLMPDGSPQASPVWVDLDG